MKNREWLMSLNNIDFGRVINKLRTSGGTFAGKWYKEGYSNFDAYLAHWLGQERVEIQLLPCPFCGGKAVIQEFNRTRKTVGCQNCHALIFGSSEQEAANRWNRRTE